jgi:competence protein ComEA
VGAAIALVLLALAVTVGIGVWRGHSTPAEIIASPDDASFEPQEAAEIYVHVAGAVDSPGLYVLGSGARVIDAVSAAGGLASDAEPGAINLARALTDGEQLVVPRKGEDPPAPAQGGPSAGPVNVNTADAVALETLPGVGPALASRIISWRETEGPFAAVDDLLAVSGIGPRVLESLRELVTV